MEGGSECTALSTFNTTSEVPLSKPPNPQLLPGRHSINGCPLLWVCVHCCVCVCVFTAVCVCVFTAVCVCVFTAVCVCMFTVCVCVFTVCVCVFTVCVCVFTVCVCVFTVCVCVFTVCVCVFTAVCARSLLGVRVHCWVCACTAVCVHFGWVKCRARIPRIDHHT